jgi:aminoglycoside phosphotransferase (APT) family kinase protein
MEYIAGRVPADDPPFTVKGWFMDLSPLDRGRVCRSSLNTMAALHSVDLDDVGLGDLGPVDPEIALDTLIDEWRQFFHWASEGEPHPVIEPAFDWLKANRPTDFGQVGLSWGDARPGNMLFSDDLEVAAVIDWEMVSVGPPEQDLAWWVYMLRHHTDAMNVPLPEGMPNADEAMAHYLSITGHELKNFEFFQVLAGIRLSSLVLRAARLMIAAGFLPKDALMGVINPATRILAELIGVAAPTGEAEYYSGNR